MVASENINLRHRAQGSIDLSIHSGSKAYNRERYYDVPILFDCEQRYLISSASGPSTSPEEIEKLVSIINGKRKDDAKSHPKNDYPDIPSPQKRRNRWSRRAAKAQGPSLQPVPPSNPANPIVLTPRARLSYNDETASSGTSTIKACSLASSDTEVSSIARGPGHQVSNNIAFFTTLRDRLACPFARIFPIGKTTCLAVSFRQLSGVKDHLGSVHSIQVGPEGESSWAALYKACKEALGYSKASRPDERIPSPNFDFDALLQDAWGLRPLPQEDDRISERKYNVISNSIGPFSQVDCDENDTFGRSLNSSSIIRPFPENDASLWVLGYLTATLISKEVAIEWLTTDSPYPVTTFRSRGSAAGPCPTDGNGQHDSYRSSSTPTISGQSYNGGSSSQNKTGKRSMEKREDAGDDDNKDMQQRPKTFKDTSTAETPRFLHLRKKYRCPFAILQCKKHGQGRKPGPNCNKDGNLEALGSCWETGETFSDTITILRDHLRKFHFSEKLPEYLTDKRAPTWHHLFEGCLDNCLDNCLGGYIHGQLNGCFDSILYLEVDPKTNKKSKMTGSCPKLYTVAEAKALEEKRQACLTEKENFSYPSDRIKPRTLSPRIAPGSSNTEDRSNDGVEPGNLMDLDTRISGDPDTNNPEDPTISNPEDLTTNTPDLLVSNGQQDLATDSMKRYGLVYDSVVATYYEVPASGLNPQDRQSQARTRLLYATSSTSLQPEIFPLGTHVSFPQQGCQDLQSTSAESETISICTRLPAMNSYRSPALSSSSSFPTYMSEYEQTSTPYTPFFNEPIQDGSHFSSILPATSNLNKPVSCDEALDTNSEEPDQEAHYPHLNYQYMSNNFYHRGHDKPRL